MKLAINEWLNQIKPLKLKKQGRKSKSIFRYGFDHLRSILLNLEQKPDEFWHTLQFLSATQKRSIHPLKLADAWFSGFNSPTPFCDWRLD